MSIEAMKVFEKNNPENKELYSDKAYKIITTDKAFDLGLYEKRFRKADARVR